MTIDRLQWARRGTKRIKFYTKIQRVCPTVTLSTSYQKLQQSRLQKLGLPRKDHYTTREVCKRLCASG
ncbi:hypothetical protein FA13DRAFT_1741255 [Coprinellus micaceus]|uniref:Uncharacterized protein n=1 Tax=Coprinellus micaceus TaxID=71717 RepID=A0A4Y7SJJ4_COPMI|nr:hypothetical protein FA13DRAFT_1741255 [Coprinellus micaceus]